MLDFRLLTREETIAALKEMGDEKYRPLIRWIAESAVFGDSCDAVRHALADAERRAENLRSKPH